MAPRDELIWQGHPSWKGMAAWYFKYFLYLLGAIVVLFLLQFAGAISFIAFFLGSLLMIGFLWGWGQLVRKTTIYTITRARVSEKRGILNTVKEQAPIHKITNITVERKLVERLMGIGRINIDTASDHLARAGEASDILAWWGLEDPYVIEGIIDGLRLENEDEWRDRGNRREQREED